MDTRIIIHLGLTAAIAIFPFLLGWLFSFLSFQKDKRRIKDELKKNSPLYRAFHRLYVWHKATVLWMIAEYLFVILPFVANVIVIYLTNVGDGNPNTEVILFYSIVSLSFVAFGYAINPQRHKKCYRKAFSSLDACINEYLSKLDDDTKNADILNKGIKEGEGFIDGACDIE